MRSVKSYFNKTLYLHDLKRGWPIWGSYLLIWFFCVPFQVFQAFGESNAYQARVADQYVLGTIRISSQICFVFAILAAMSLFQYLYQPRSANGLHSLPLRREGHFLTHVAAGITYFLGSNIVIALLTLLAEGLSNSVNATHVLLWLLYNSCIMLLFFGLAVFCAQFTGHIVALSVFYVIWNFIFYFLYYVLYTVSIFLLYGFNGFLGLEEVVEYLTPLVAVDKLYVAVLDEANQEFYTQLNNIPLALAFAIVGILLLVAAMMFYRRRRLESAGDVVAVRGAIPLFRYGLAFCFGIGLSLFLMGALYIRSKTFFYCAAVICGVIGCFVAEMLIQKSFRVFRTSKKKALGFAAVMLAIIIGIGLDLTGFERRVPEASKVESVQVYDWNTYPMDSAAHVLHVFSEDDQIADILAAHSQIVSEHWEKDYDIKSSTLSLLYTLTDGSEMTRSYSFPVTDEYLADAGSAASMMLELINDPTVLPLLFDIDAFTRDDITSADIRVFREDSDRYTLSQIQTHALYDAVMADFANGRIGQRRYTHQDTADWLVKIYYYIPRVDIYTPSTTAYIDFIVEPHSTATRAILEEMLHITLFDEVISD